jgi:gluconate 2-dehydrogenase gamma chain
VEITRREAVRRLTVLLGGAASASTVTALLSGCDVSPPSPEWTPSALSREQVELLGVVVDRIIPPTDTPGARDVGVPAFIDLLLDRWAEPEERVRFLDGLDGLDSLMSEQAGSAFVEAGADAQIALLARLDEQAVRAREEEVDPLPFFATLKEWTLAGYYTSEVGATRELQWLPMPGRYDGDAALEEVGRTWA